jgi:hypothetical protein
VCLRACMCPPDNPVLRGLNLSAEPQQEVIASSMRDSGLGLGPRARHEVVTALSAGMDVSVEDAERRRREFIRAHHPDRGGDPEVFAAGLRSFDADREADWPQPLPLPRVVIVPRRTWLAALADAVIKRLRPGSKAPRVR